MTLRPALRLVDLAVMHLAAPMMVPVHSPNPIRGKPCPGGVCTQSDPVAVLKKCPVLSAGQPNRLGVVLHFQ